MCFLNTTRFDIRGQQVPGFKGRRAEGNPSDGATSISNAVAGFASVLPFAHRPYIHPDLHTHTHTRNTQALLLNRVSAYVDRMLRVFGVHGDRSVVLCPLFFFVL